MTPIILPGLRYRRLWICIGLLLVLAICVVCLAPARDLPKVHLWDKAQHMIAFGTLAFWFGGIVVRRELLWVAVGVILFGGLIEVAQGTMHLGRDADWHDLAADAFGTVIGVMLALTPLGRWVCWFEALVARAAP
ncbi:MAG TPA: VanZ family protein [Steroidobacteraceae bacterium]|nr:VanZ family protein [Steroidobacteraceae bacterium]